MKTSAHTSHECFIFKVKQMFFFSKDSCTPLQKMHHKMFLQDYPVSERTTSLRSFYSLHAVAK